MCPPQAQSAPAERHVPPERTSHAVGRPLSPSNPATLSLRRSVGHAGGTVRFSGFASHLRGGEVGGGGLILMGEAAWSSVCAPLSHASAQLPRGHDPSRSSEHEDETKAPRSAHDANHPNRKGEEGERERGPGHPGGSDRRSAVQSLCLLVSWIKECHKRNAAPRASAVGARRDAWGTASGYAGLPRWGCLRAWCRSSGLAGACSSRRGEF